MNVQDLWDRYRRRVWFDNSLGVAVDVSRMNLDSGFLDKIRPAMNSAFTAMAELERGVVANPDEGRRVGHYWLRAPELAPDPAIGESIRGTVVRIGEFARAVHEGTVAPQQGGRFTSFLLVGIGGSALGPQFVSDALGGRADRMQAHFMDNTDPDGMDRTLDRIGDNLPFTLTVVVSKSGGTKETRNGMREVAAAYRRLGLDFARHAVAVTGAGSRLEREAHEEGFLDVFPMWDWVGGRTSELSAVGLLPAALQGFDIEGLLAGAKAMDERTRRPSLEDNPAALLAASWYRAGNGRGDRDMVILPYKDRLHLLGRYLQQLVMESLGKGKDLDGNPAHQGIVVYGNKGSTDQHAYVQQLRDGPDNFFVTFVQVLRDRRGSSVAVEPDTTSGDYLLGFLWGTREALSEKGRTSITLTLAEVSAETVGMLIALYERAVGLYAGLIHVNAYHQPGVEAGKKAAEAVLALQRRVLAVLREEKGKRWTLEELAQRLDAEDSKVALWKVLEHAAANPDHGVVWTGGEGPGEGWFSTIA